MEFRCYIGIGSNLDNPQARVLAALETIRGLPQSQLVSHSPWYQSKAIGPGEQPDYINGVAQLDTRLNPTQLLRELQAIEALHGRERSIRWGPRTLDLDILLYGDETVSTEILEIPHPRMKLRNFVIYPLRDLAPGLEFPDGSRLEDIYCELDHNGLEKIDINR